MNTFYTQKIQKAISFSIKVHQIDQNQTRKGKTVPYVIHPLSIGIILSRVGSEEDIIVAGILHDTIEDCKPYGSVTKEKIAVEFGKRVAEMVDDVTEQDISLPWMERKMQALEHIKEMSQDSLLVKSADVLHNLTDQLHDYEAEGEKMFLRFNASKAEQLHRYQKLINAIGDKWPENPLLPELISALQKAKKLWKS